MPNHIEPTTKLALSILTTVGAYFLSPPSFFFMTAAGSVLINIADAYHMCHSACRSVWERVGSQNKEAAPTRESEPTGSASPIKRAKITLFDPQAGNPPHVRFSPIINEEEDTARSIFATWAQDPRVDRSVARGSGRGPTEIIEIKTLGSNSPPSRTSYQDLGMHRPASKPSGLPNPPIAGSGRCTPIQGSGRSTPQEAGRRTSIDLLEPRFPTSRYRSNFQSH